MGTNELSAVLWKERELLELLHFKLEEEHLLLISGKSQWIALSTREIENVLQKAHAASLARAVEAAQLATSWGLDADSPLSQIIDATPAGPWNGILTIHLTALRKTTTEITQLRDANDQYLRAACRSTQKALAALSATDALRLESVSLEARRSSSADLDLDSDILELKTQEVVYQIALSAAASTLQPALMDFLR